ncbi:hypothetical protein PR048_024292 [Dryococelus australis]|uniref:Uncharacterized protein n=1 Tax=Dryococelus australis TaxID=614101 RepID=A0ABQ9GN81_9NEOP|nr:hypothetical protein PR048_024292 [Dryococelus australis]
MEDALSLKIHPMDAEIGTTYHWIWMAGPKSAEEPHTGWSGFMEIDAGKRAYEKKRQQRCIVMFDQLLFIKAIDIVSQVNETDELSKVIVRLGRFHLLVSHMGAVGKIIGGSGMEEMWGGVFAKNAVVHMANGHAYARALRAHSLSQAAMTHLILECCEEEGFLISSDVQTIREIHNEMFHLSPSKEYIQAKVDLNAVSKLWLQYFKQVTIIHDFVRAERTAHLHAAGHIHYAKSANVYLQNMYKLKTALSTQEFERFVSQGVWTDMTIEQILMRSMKVSGDLTQGRNMSDSVVAR